MPKNFLFLLLIFAQFFATKSVECFPSAADADEINNLPGINFPLNFKHYSGFLRVSPTHFLHYWLVTSQGNASVDPLIFWFNGGPGGSSIEGLLHEMGPYQIRGHANFLYKNPNAWNKFASIVYIESPAGVGFSYATDGNIITDDALTASEHYAALGEFFARHPQFLGNPIFIAGESYGGVYVPTLAVLIIDRMNEFKINLTGLAIGNGYMNHALEFDTSIKWAYAHGLVDERIWNKIELDCCRGRMHRCALSKMTGTCKKIVDEIHDYLFEGGLNPYDLYRDCYQDSTQSASGLLIRKGILLKKLSNKSIFGQNSTFFNAETKYENDDDDHSGIPCENDGPITKYMNKKEVRHALNIPPAMGAWEIANKQMGDDYGQIYDDMSPFIKKTLKAGIRGDTDMMCNFMMGQQFSAQIGLKNVSPKKPWKFNRQIAGFQTLYKAKSPPGASLTFLTILGAGHMSPQWRPAQTAYVLQQFLGNRPIGQ